MWLGILLKYSDEYSDAGLDLMKSGHTSAVLDAVETQADVPLGDIDRGKDPFEVLTQSVGLGWIYGPAPKTRERAIGSTSYGPNFGRSAFGTDTTLYGRRRMSLAGRPGRHVA